MWRLRDEGYCLLLMCVLGTSTGLSCYSCSGSDQNSSCLHDVNGMMTSRVNYGGEYSKDCDLEINQTMCVIETSAASGELKTIIRGCSNGYIFSFTDVKLFKGLSPTNQTTCAVYMGIIVCMTLCDQSYCNGPQHFVETSSSSTADSTHIMLRIVVIILCLYSTVGRHSQFIISNYPQGVKSKVSGGQYQQLQHQQHPASDRLMLTSAAHDVATRHRDTSSNVTGTCSLF